MFRQRLTFKPLGERHLHLLPFSVNFDRDCIVSAFINVPSCVNDGAASASAVYSQPDNSHAVKIRSMTDFTQITSRFLIRLYL